MSTIAVNAITDANGGSTTSINGTTPNAYNTVGKNLIINGAMQVNQRGDQSGLTDDAYTLDRWQFAVFGSSGHGTYTVSQDSSVKPDAFGESLKIACTTADTSIASDIAIVLRQRIEGQNLQQLAYATTNAKDVTLSFWVRSNLTGTGVVNLYSVDANKHAGATYTINSSNTWERKTVTIAGDTSSGFDNNNGNSLEVRFYFAAGSDFSSGTQVDTWASRTSANDAADLTLDIGSSTSNYINITGVQLEVGESATEFEHRPYTTELQLCQRYYENTYPAGSAVGSVTWGPINFRAMPSGATDYACFSYAVVKRAIPTLTAYNGNTGASGSWRGSSGNNRTITLNATESTWGFYATGWSLGDFVQRGHFTADAEL